MGLVRERGGKCLEGDLTITILSKLKDRTSWHELLLESEMWE